MALINKDLPWTPITSTPWFFWAIFGFLIAYFFTDTVVYIVTGIGVTVFVVIWIDKSGRELDMLGNIAALIDVGLCLAATWITMLFVSGWGAGVIGPLLRH